MATNTLAGVNPTRISQLSLEVLKTEGIPLSAFTTDFSGALANSGDVVTTRFATLPASQDFDSDARAATAAASTARSVTLDQYRGVSISFSDTERAFSDIDLVELYIQPAISVLVDEMISNTLSNVNATNGFDTNEQVIASTALDADKVADLAEGLTTRKVPRAGRSLIVKPTYHVTLAKDTVITAASDGPSGTLPIRTSQVPVVHGFGTHEYAGTIPANDINLAGIACGKQALCLANRQVPTPENWYGQVRNIRDPKSGLVLQFRAYYDGVKQVYEWCTLYGSAVGIADYATAIVSA